MRYLKLAASLVLFVSILFFCYSKYVEYKRTDSTLPVITGSKESLKLSCDYTEKDMLEGLTAFDEKDGDLTDKIMIGNISRFYDTGRCKVSYVVFDSANQPATFSREIEFTDYESPEFALSTPLVFSKGSVTDISSQIGAVDMLDGDISQFVKLTENDVDFSTAGDYHVNVQATNSFGDIAELELPVHIVNSSQRVLTIELKENIVYIEKGEKFNPMSFVEGVYRADGDELDKEIISAESNVKDETGCYEVKYTADAGGAQKGVTWLTVVVR